MSPYLAFASLDKKSVRFTIPLCTIRRVERLNARAGVYALSLSLWHGLKIVSLQKSVLDSKFNNLVPDRTVDVSTSHSRPLLFAASRLSEIGIAARTDEVCQEFRQDVLFGGPYH
jgi:hypothetical protein